MSNFCIDIESGRAFIYEQTLESMYMQGRFGAVPIIKGITGNTPNRPQFVHTSMNIVEPKKLAKELKMLAQQLEASREGTELK